MGVRWKIEPQSTIYRRCSFTCISTVGAIRPSGTLLELLVGGCCCCCWFWFLLLIANLHIFILIIVNCPLRLALEFEFEAGLGR
jgi:hypothetical protein